MNLDEALSLRDLTDPSAGPHAMQILVRDLRASLLRALGPLTAVLEHRGPRVVAVLENYDALRFPAETMTRDRRYTRYVDDRSVLRTHTSAMIPRLLRDLARTLAPGEDVLLRVSDLERTLTHDEANELRDTIHAALHEGTVHAWACGSPPRGLR